MSLRAGLASGNFQDSFPKEWHPDFSKPRRPQEGPYLEDLPEELHWTDDPIKRFMQDSEDATPSPAVDEVVKFCQTAPSMEVPRSIAWLDDTAAETLDRWERPHAHRPVNHFIHSLFIIQSQLSHLTPPRIFRRPDERPLTVSALRNRTLFTEEPITLSRIFRPYEGALTASALRQHLKQKVQLMILYKPITMYLATIVEGFTG